MTDSGATNEKMLKTCMALYAAYAASALSTFIPLWSVVILTTIALIVAVSVAYKQQKLAGDTVYASHFHWLIRTFWIGGFVYLPVLTVLMFITVAVAVDWSELMAAVQRAALEQGSSPSKDDAQVVIDTVKQQIIDRNLTKLVTIVVCYIFPVIGWWLWRCWKGFKLLKANQPVPDVMSWM